MAVGRFELRRDLVQKEANTIGTTWLRAGLLPESHRGPAKQLLRRYTDLRIEYQKLSENPAKVALALRIGGELEANLWRHAEAAAQEAPTHYRHIHRHIE
jgi:hypothetical protein